MLSHLFYLQVNKLATVFLACVIISILCIWVGILGSLGEQDVCMMSSNDTKYLVKKATENCTTIPGAAGLVFSFCSSEAN